MADLRTPARPLRPRPPQSWAGRRAEPVDTGRGFEAPHHGIRPRIGVGPRREPRAARTLFQTPSTLHLIAIATSFVILGGGLGLTLHLLGSNNAPEPEAAAARAPAAPEPRVVSVSPSVADASGKATATASALVAPAPTHVPPPAAPSSVPAAPATPVAAPMATASAAQSATTGESGTPAPTADDFKRPAFLEPMPADDTASGNAADEAHASAAAAAVAAPEPEAVPDAKVPLPEERPARMATASTSATDAAPSSASAADTDGRTAKLTMDVTFRSEARRGSSVLATLSQGDEVKVISCKSWCEIIAGGKHGYVFNNAIPKSAR